MTANKLNSTARQASAERAWAAISRFFDNCKKKVCGKKGFPKFKKHPRSVEYKRSGWKLHSPKQIEFTDKNGIGKLKLVGTWDLAFYSSDQIKRVRLVKRADGYYAQFCIKIDIEIESNPPPFAPLLGGGLGGGWGWIWESSIFLQTATGKSGNLQNSTVKQNIS